MDNSLRSERRQRVDVHPWALDTHIFSLCFLFVALCLSLSDVVVGLNRRI